MQAACVRQCTPSFSRMQGEASQDINRPCLVKEDELKNLEVSVDEDDGGWAGHHAEVDYSKEVVFDDSDEEVGDERERSVASHSAWERIDDGGHRHKHSPAALQVCKLACVRM